MNARRSGPLCVLVLLGQALPVPAARAQHTLELNLATGAIVHPEAPEAIVHIPRHFNSSEPFDLVVFFHGYEGCARVLAYSGPTACFAAQPPRPGWDLLARHDDAGTNSIFVIAQLAMMVRDGSPGAFTRRGRFRGFLTDVISAAAQHGAHGPPRSVTLLAHSAAFETAIAVIRRGEVQHLDNLVLFDALYSGVPVFASWIRVDSITRRLVSIYTGSGTTARRQRELRGAVRPLPVGAELTDIARVPISVVRSHVSHARVPAEHLAAVLRALLIDPQRLRTDPSTTISGR